MGSNRPSGRKKTFVGGGGNANRRGSGLGGGPVGSGSRPSGGSSGEYSGGSSGGNRSTGGNALLAIAALLLGKKLAGGGNGGSSNGSGTSKSGCITRIIILVAVVAVIYLLVQSCSGGGGLSSILGGLTNTETEYEDPSYDEPTVTEPAVTATEIPEAADAAEAFDIDQLFGTLDGSTAAVSSTAPAYGAHSADTTVATAARERYTTIAGDGADTVTVMVFMCGSTLESNSGLATRDLKEMTNAKLSRKVNVIVETGGASSWKNNLVSARTNQRYQVGSGGLKVLDKNVGNNSMVEPDTLSSFIRFCTEKFPADRYMLVFWDHGGGSISGYGYDEHFPDGTMTIDKINEALSDGGCKFDFIGFDTCLMATLETALVAEQYADYLIASEAVEPGGGWYYTDWLTALSQNTSIPTVDLGKRIIDDYVDASAIESAGAKATLSLTDLAELSGTVPAAFRSFSQATNALISADGYEQVASARSSARDFSSSQKINQIDLIHFAENLGTDEGDALCEALRGAIKYNRTSENITHANGLSIYFPYQSLSSVSKAIATYNKVGLDDSYTECIRSFASMTAGGSVVSGGSDSALGTLLGDSSGSLLGTLLGADAGSLSSSSDSTEMIGQLLGAFLGRGDRSVVTGDSDNSWINEDLLNSSVPYFADRAVGLDTLMLTQNSTGETVLTLTNEQWKLIRTIELNVFLDDGEGYIDLGLDNVFTWDDGGNLLMTFDGTWLSLNGQIVSYYFLNQEQVDQNVIITGYVPALLNGKRANIILMFDDETPEGRVAGAQMTCEGADTTARGLVDIVKGDTLDFLCDYYTYDGVYSDSYFLGEQMTATGEWVIGNAPVGEGKTVMTYRLTDIYGAKYWTPGVE